MLALTRSLLAAAYAAIAPGAPPTTAVAPGIESCDTATLDTDPRHYYLGYRRGDHATKWAKHFREPTTPLAPAFVDGLLNSPHAAELGVALRDAPARLEQPGYLALENGWTRLPDGTLYVAVLSELPAVTGEMLDFWFYWHADCSSKYKLWHPHAHRYAWVRRRAGVSSEALAAMPYRERYWDRTSFVEEYIGGESGKLSIGFFDPRLFGFALATPAGVETVVTALVQPGRFVDVQPQKRAAKGPAAVGATQIVVMHQVRRKPDGSGRREMRSRFWFGPVLVAGWRAIGTDPARFGHDMAVHCHVEMTHLGTVLPGVFDEFRDDVW